MEKQAKTPKCCNNEPEYCHSIWDVCICMTKFVSYYDKFNELKGPSPRFPGRMFPEKTHFKPPGEQNADVHKQRIKVV